MVGLSSPRPRLVYTLPFSNPRVRGAFFVMAPGNRAVVQRTWGLHELEARRLELRANSKDTGVPGAQQQQQSLTYGRQFRYDEFIAMPNAAVAIVFSIVFALGAAAMAFITPVIYLVFDLLTPITNTVAVPMGSEETSHSTRTWANRRVA